MRTTTTTTTALSKCKHTYSFDMAESLKGPFSQVPVLQNKSTEATGLRTFEWKNIVKEKKIGSGSFGSVYLAQYGNPAQKVVLKKLKSLSLDAKARFKEEATRNTRNCE